MIYNFTNYTKSHPWTETTVYNGACNYNCNCNCADSALLDLEGGLSMSPAPAAAAACAPPPVSSGISTPCMFPTQSQYSIFLVYRQ